MSCPIASIIIPTYNVEACLERAVQSVLAQSLQDFEIIIVDDCSTDNTVKIIYSLIQTDRRVRLIRLEKNSGPAAARNAGFAAAEGEWLVPLDADDSLTPLRLEKLITTAESNKLDMIADNIIFFDADAKKEVSPVFINKEKNILHINMIDHLASTTFKPKFMKIFDKIKESTSLLHFAFRKSFIQNNELSYPEHLRAAEDFYFYTLCILRGAKAAVVPEPMYIYTQRHGSISKKKSALTRTPPVEKILISKSASDLLEKYGEHFTNKEKQQLLKRVNYGIAIQKLSQIKQLIADRHYSESLKILVMTPKIWLLVIQRFIHLL